MASIFIPASKRKLACAFCLSGPGSREASVVVSVCNFELRTAFRGCGEPFFQKHGLAVGSFERLPDFLLWNRSDKEESKSEIQERVRTNAIAILNLPYNEEANFRACNPCLKQAWSKLKTRKRLQIIKTLVFYLAVFAALISIGAALFLSKIHSQLYCEDDSILSVLSGECYVKQTEPFGLQYLSWMEHNNPGITRDCKQQYWNRALLRCICSNLHGGYTQVKLGPDGKSIKEEEIKFCPKPECPADGIHFILYGECRDFDNGSIEITPKTNLTSNLTINGEPPLCKSFTMFIEKYNTCFFANCDPKYYHTSLVTMRCGNCPPYKVQDSYNTCREIEHYADEEGKVELYPTLDGKWEACPPDSGVPPELRTYLSYKGYYYRKRTYRNYVVCPVIVWPKARKCLPKEMLIRHIIKCTSICEPCTQQWDYGKRKCVPRETSCVALGSKLLSTGECSSITDQIFDNLAPEIYVCEEPSN